MIITPSGINKDDLGQVWTSALKECNLGAQWIEEVKKNRKIKVYTETVIKKITGAPGLFDVELRSSRETALDEINKKQKAAGQTSISRHKRTKEILEKVA